MLVNKRVLAFVTASLVACGGGEGEPGATGASAGGSSSTTSNTGGATGGTGGTGGIGGDSASGGSTMIPGDGFASDYPGDVGLDSHAAVLFYEDFEDGDVGTVAAGWDSVGGDQTFSLEGDVPAGAPAGAQSLRMTGDGGSLYENLPDQQGTVFVRYYVKYDSQSQYHHSGMWLGGFNPPTQWPQGTAGLRPDGSDFFHNAFEPAGSGDALVFDHYAQWPGMDCFQEPGGCWGNSLLGNDKPSLAAGAWACVELMMRMNTPGQSDGEYAVWNNGALIQHLAPGSPSFNRLGNGVWEPDPNGEPFPGFDWRDTTELAFNWIWLNFFVDGASTMSWDQVVVATERIGCMAPAN
jgi:hypothetical protein